MHAQFQFAVRNNGTEVGIATALAITIEGSLNLNSAVANGDHRIGNSHIRVIVCVNADRCFDRCHGCQHPVSDFFSQRTTVGVAQHDSVRTSLLGRFQSR